MRKKVTARYRGKAVLQQLAIGAAMILVAPVIALAQQITGTPGSPSATTSLSGKQLPPPDPKFDGVIKDGVLQSKPWWAPRVVPPKGAPNVLLIMKRTLPMILQWDESFDIGSDTRKRHGLQAAICADRQAQQADDQGRPPAVVTRGYQETAGGDAGEGKGRLIQRRRRGTPRVVQSAERRV
jgi:hypothetical protein